MWLKWGSIKKLQETFQELPKFKFYSINAFDSKNYCKYWFIMYIEGPISLFNNILLKV